MATDMEVELLHQRAADSFTAFQRALTEELYGDAPDSLPLSRWQRFKGWLADNRVTNAWLVLIGREDIDRGYY